jgi:hypothetical protein
MDENAPCLGAQPFEPAKHLVRAGGLLVEGRSVAERGSPLERARPLPHDDEAVDALLRARPGERGRVISRGGGDDAALALLL